MPQGIVDHLPAIGSQGIVDHLLAIGLSDVEEQDQAESRNQENSQNVKETFNRILSRVKMQGIQSLHHLTSCAKHARAEDFAKSATSWHLTHATVLK